MPHIPRQSSTTGPPMELMQRPPAGAPPRRAEKPKPPDEQRRSMKLGVINPRTYEPDQKQILKALFGTEPDVDPHTGQLVPPERRG